LKFKLWKTERNLTTRTVRVLPIGRFTLLTIDFDFDPGAGLSLDVTVGQWKGRRLHVSLGGVWFLYLAPNAAHKINEVGEISVSGPSVQTTGRS